MSFWKSNGNFHFNGAATTATDGENESAIVDNVLGFIIISHNFGSVRRSHRTTFGIFYKKNYSTEQKNHFINRKQIEMTIKLTKTERERERERKGCCFDGM